MIDVAVAFLFQAAAGAPAQAPAPPASEEVTVVGKAEEPRIVCRMEFVTGSRVKKEKVCAAPPNKAQDTQTNLQREMARKGDFSEPPEVFGN
jgi:hypothetical protein